MTNTTYTRKHVKLSTVTHPTVRLESGLVLDTELTGLIRTASPKVRELVKVHIRATDLLIMAMDLAKTNPAYRPKVHELEGMVRRSIMAIRNEIGGVRLEVAC